MRQKITGLDACGSVRVRDEARRELRKLGARSEPRGPAAAGERGVTALTARELEIAELVESHMSHIFRKLGVSSRVQVARAVERARQA